ncbi:uncharacterized protein C2845_PM06G28810 [Panicum miliaceum]|uniref:Uncharacterized protein n=1 Tax=Panicum miliaceum TaxID=4540 RepID=A0A3L6RAX7_PANMI|nr:uncharacterized protein C2845_PM06G28810 [Panicum miliaceum]
MSVDDCIFPLPTPLSEGAPLLKAAARCGSLPSLSELDLYATSAADSGAAASAWCGDAGKGGCTVGEFLNGLVAEIPGTRSVPSRYHLAISTRDDPGGHNLRLLIPSRDDSGLNLRPPALAKENPHGQGSAETFSALSLHEVKDALTGKPEQRQTSQVAASRTAWRGRYARSKAAPDVVRQPKKKKSPEERKAIGEKKIIQSERASPRHVETALRKYKNTTTSENDVLLCCIFGEKDAGHCHACEDYRPMMVHRSNHAYGGDDDGGAPIPCSSAMSAVCRNGTGGAGLSGRRTGNVCPAETDGASPGVFYGLTPSPADVRGVP